MDFMTAILVKLSLDNIGIEELKQYFSEKWVNYIEQ